MVRNDGRARVRVLHGIRFDTYDGVWGGRVYGDDIIRVYHIISRVCMHIRIHHNIYICISLCVCVLIGVHVVFCVCGFY